MSDYDRRPTNVNVTPGPTTVKESGGGGLYFIVGALVVAVLVGGFLLFGGNLGNRADVARAPAKVDVTIEQPKTPAMPTAPAPTTPAAPRQ